MADYKLDFDGQTVSFTEGENITFSGGGIAELVLYYDNDPVGEMYVSMVSGAIPADNETISGASGAAVVNGTPYISRFPVHIRDDISYDNLSNIRWTGQALGHTHSCKFDGQTVNLALGNITFSGGGTAELIAQTDAGGTGELFFRMTNTILPLDNETISDAGTGDGAVNGVAHVRAYTPNNIHYWFADKGDDASFTGNDEQDRTKPRVSERVGVTDVNFLGNANIDDTVSYHMYGGSIQQNSGDDEYNAVTIAVVDVDGLTEPVIIQDNALHSAITTEYWNNAFMPDAASKVNLLIKVKAGGVVTDRRVVRFRALEEFRQYFTAPDPTLSGGITPVSLVATDDGNHTNDASAFLATAAYGYQTVDHNNDSGAQPYWMVMSDNGDTKTQVHERFKWEQRRGTATTVHGLNAQLIVGNDLTIQYDGEGNTLQFTEGETITFGGNSTGTALLLALDDQGTTGSMYCQRLTGDVPLDNATITGNTSTETAVVNGAPTDRLIINNLVGGYTGSAFNPANIGITLAASDADNSDLFLDLLEVQQAPPNNQIGVVNASANDTITVYPWDGATFDAAGDREPDFDRLTSSATYSGVTVTSITVNEAIPTWFPASGGSIRCTLASGARLLVAVSSWTGSTFTIPSTDFSGDNLSINNGVMPAPIDAQYPSGVAQFTGVYTADQDGDGSGDQSFVATVSNSSGATAKQPSSNLAVFTSGGFSLNVSLVDD